MTEINKMKSEKPTKQPQKPQKTEFFMYKGLYAIEKMTLNFINRRASPNYMETNEDLYVAIVRKNPNPEVVNAKPGDYALFHAIDGTSNPAVGISYEHMVGYLAGALYGKSSSHITLTNGVTDEGRSGWFPNIKFDPIPTATLERIIIDARLNHRFNINDFR